MHATGSSLKRSLAAHVHTCVPFAGSPGGLQGKAAGTRFDEPLEQAMGLLDPVGEIFDLPQFHACSKHTGGFEFTTVLKMPLAVWASRLGLKSHAHVFPAQSMFQAALQALRCDRQRFSSSGA
jgi:hypothetical protein